jgi:single-stranded-DNA-specific exonuclease
MRRHHRPLCAIDALAPLTEFTPAIVQALDRLAPFGNGNEPPMLLSEGLRPIGIPRLRGRQRQHLAFKVHAAGATLDAIAFHAAARADELAACARIDLVHTPALRRIGRSEAIQLEVHDFRGHPQA